MDVEDQQPTPDRLIRIDEVRNLVGRSRASIYRDVSKWTFPQPVKAGASTRWFASEIQDYIRRLPRVGP